MIMTPELQKDAMDIDIPRGSEDNISGLHEKSLTLHPVSINESGEGFPYAPEDLPNPGDKWRWRVGHRIGAKGYFRDRYMYLPYPLRTPGPKGHFSSRISVVKYVQENFPSTDIARFVASYSWKIPSKNMKKGDTRFFKHPGIILEDIREAHCKADNNSCISLAADKDSSSEIMFCDICCVEPGFCRDCCCILCCGIIDKASYGYIRCEANVDGSTCGHSCHVECALRAYMAGTVGGSTGLDAEYYCRRCDSRTDMISYVEKLLENCKSVASRGDVERILRVAVRVLEGSKKTGVSELLRHIELVVSKAVGEG